MTPQLEAAIAAIQPLSPAERQQLVQILIQDNSELKQLNAQFQQGIELKQLLATQNPKTFYNLEDFAADFFPEEDSIEEFLLFLRQQRQIEI